MRNKILLLVSSTVSPLHQELIYGVDSYCQSHNIDLVVSIIGILNSPKSYKHRMELLNLIDTEDFDGVIIPSSSMFRLAEQKQIDDFFNFFNDLPIVTIGSMHRDYPFIKINYYTSMKKLVKHLIKEHGRTKIALIRGQKNHLSSNERELGYIDALKECNLPFEPELITIQESFKAIDGVKSAKELLDNYPDIDGFVTVADNISYGVLQELEDRGVAVPETISVTGFQNIAGTEGTNPPLTTVNERMSDQGYEAACILHKMILGKSFSLENLLEPELIIRESCGCKSHGVHYLNNLKVVKSEDKETFFEELYNVKKVNTKIRSAIKSLQQIGMGPRTEEVLQSVVRKTLSVLLNCDLGIEEAFVCLFDSEHSDITRLFSWKSPRYENSDQTIEFNKKSILPIKLFNKSRAGSKIITPLYSLDRPLGYIVSDIPLEYLDILENLLTRISMAITTHHKTEYIKSLAYYDDLTGLPNRRFFMDCLENEISQVERKGEKLALLFLDLDDFKIINDSRGHNYGDMLLQQVVTRFKDAIRNGDWIGRWGGDEFLFALPYPESTNDIEVVIKRILKRVSQPINIFEEDFRVSASIGVAIYPEDGESSIELLQCADRAMYEAKELKNHYQFYNHELKINESEVQMMNNLRSAIENHELYMVYQPIIDLETENLAGFEALLRWESKDGLIPPSIFIPLAEREFGLIQKISRWVVKEAAKQVKRWKNQGYFNYFVSVNVSAKQFKNKKLAQDYLKIIRDEGVDPKYIDLEITESSYINDLSNVNEILDEFIESGVQISLDDFGTGYSSINLLKQLGFHKLKIDRSYTNCLDINTADCNGTDCLGLVTAIIGMAKALNMKIVAEGVESREQLNKLKELKCEQVQGYYFSKPLEADEIEKRYLSI